MYNKLFGKILDSSIWLELTPTRIVWITLLAAMDEDGFAHFSAIENLAIRARVTVDEAQHAVEIFMAPDPNSGNPANEGRRIERVPGGFMVLNATVHRATINRVIQREQTRIRVARHRAKHAVTKPVTQMLPNDTRPPYTEADTEADTETTTTTSSEHAVKNNVPFKEILVLYHQTLPELPKCIKLTEQRKGHIRQRWLQDLPDLPAWERYFKIVKESRFLTGKLKGSNDKPPFRADLAWLVKPENIVKVIEGKYHHG